MKIEIHCRIIFLVVAAAFSGSIFAASFETENFSGNFDVTLTAGLGMRLKDPSCSRIGDPSFCASADTGGWSNSDNGNLNYKKDSLFTEYVKGNQELLLKFPDSWKFFGRFTWLYDFKADDTVRTPLSTAAKNEIVNPVRLYDLWISKEISIGDNLARIRLGNQVISWGESLFLPGGINSTNQVDIQRLSQPGTPLKEVFLPAPMISVASGIGHGINIEAYYQFRWYGDRQPPVGAYWSVADIFQKGSQPIFLNPTNFNIGGLDPAAAAQTGQPQGFPINGLNDIKPKNSGQDGASVRYQPTGTNVNLGFYYLNYHDKTPVLNYADYGASYQWSFLENRKLYGVSANFPLGDWAVGWELSYRPKDAVSLSGCYNPGGPLDANTNAAPVQYCQAYIDQKRYQMHLTGLLSLTPGDYGRSLDLLGADTATLLAEAVGISYPNLQNQYVRTAADGTPVMQVPAAGYWTWTQNDPTLGQIAAPAGTKNSWGYNFDFSWTYDGKLIPGWQVTPELYYFQAVSGRTPNFTANFMTGAKSANFIVTFTQNPANWVFGVNYAKWWGGKTPFDQPYADRGFIGGYLSRNF